MDNASVDELSEPTVSQVPFGKMKDGTANALYTLTNGKGITMKVMNYGGIIVSLIVPDAEGNPVDVILGFDSLAQYEKIILFSGHLLAVMETGSARLSLPLMVKHTRSFKTIMATISTVALKVLTKSSGTLKKCPPKTVWP